MMALENEYPDAVALLDWLRRNKSLPRREVKLAEIGKQLATAVSNVLKEDMKPIKGAATATYGEIDLGLAKIPSPEELGKNSRGSDSPESHRAKVSATAPSNGVTSRNHKDFGSFVARDGATSTSTSAAATGTAGSDGRRPATSTPSPSTRAGHRPALRREDHRDQARPRDRRPPGPWTVEIRASTSGDGRRTPEPRRSRPAVGGFNALGGYQPGSAAFGDVVGGIAYTITEPDPLGDGMAEITSNPVHILGYRDPDREQNELVTITNRYPETGGGGGPATGRARSAAAAAGWADRPRPRSRRRPAGRPNADLVVTHTITPARVRVGDTILGHAHPQRRGDSRGGAVARELPQYRALEANGVARIRVDAALSAAGTCTSRRPLRCTLGTLAPGAQVVLRTRAVMLVAAPLQSVVIGLLADARVQHDQQHRHRAGGVREAAPHLRVGISAPPSGRVGAGLDYRVR